MFRLIKILIIFSIFTSIIFCNAIGQIDSLSPLEISKKVADKIIRETTFKFELVPQMPSTKIQTINISDEFTGIEKSICYAVTYINSPKNATYKLGISHTVPISVFINNELIYSRDTTTGIYREIAYDIYKFPVEIPIKLKSGTNKLLIKALIKNQDVYTHIGILDDKRMLENSLSFNLKEVVRDSILKSPWLIIGPFMTENNSHTLSLTTTFPPEKDILNYYPYKVSIFTWKAPNTRLILKDVIPEGASFKKHSYFEWHYANGQTMLALLALGNATNDKTYVEFVKEYCDVTLKMYDYFKYQYEKLHDKTGFNYRLYRKAMLDDTSAPILPFIELYLSGFSPDSKFLIDSVINYVMSEQVRLTDGTLCRPEPEANTIWADDLFMSVPFLLRYAKVSGDVAYYEEAVKQIVSYNKYLFDNESGLYFHGWFGSSGKNSIAKWGRANGWIAWATTEALTYLPELDSNYETILELYKRQMKELIKYQGKCGLWHQILDREDSFEETSSTAMFVLAMARGIRNGWIGKEYLNSVLIGWEGIKNMILPDGTVTGICQGTEIGNSYEFYYKRKTNHHDPRGLGAVITAGVEVQLLSDKLNIGKD